MTTFEFNGYTYRVIGQSIQALDTRRHIWVATYSAAVRNAARQLGLI
jgi:hypothetical protein